MASHFDNLANPRHPSDSGVIFATRYWAFLCHGGVVSTYRRDRERGSRYPAAVPRPPGVVGDRGGYVRLAAAEPSRAGAHRRGGGCPALAL